MGNVTPYAQRLPALSGDWPTDMPTIQAFMARFLSDTVNTTQGNVQVENNLGGEFKELSVVTPTTDWTTVTAFLNGWLALGTPYAAPQFRLRSDGVVELRGILKSGAVGSPAFTLPSGYAPANTGQLVFSVASNNAFGRLDVDISGNVTPTVGSNVYFGMDGVSFASALNTPGKYSCFPLQYQSALKTISAVKIAKAVNVTDQSVSASVGNPAWSFDGKLVTVSTIPGLALGKKYTITLEALP